MASASSLGDILIQSTELWRSGQHAKALTLIDEWIAKMEEKKDVGTSVQLLRMHACLIAGAMNDWRLVRHYCDEVLAVEPENALTFYTLADAMFRQGEVNLAKLKAARAYALVCHSHDARDRGLLELLIKRWPEIGDW
ncbi:MAG TPA: hypothetical protein VHX36_09485 [Candidatus Acidoferrales bacterium]|jgi:hypothetical protein|nr:hypothetical protein [Candidatus Acidoferrales bacterium]